MEISAYWKKKMKKSYVSLCLEFLDLNSQFEISKALNNKKLYDVVQFSLSQNVYNKSFFPPTEKTFPFNLIGNVNILANGVPPMVHNAIAIEDNYILTAIEPFTKLAKYKNDSYLIKFVLNDKEYESKQLVSFFNNNLNSLYNILDREIKSNNDNRDMLIFLSRKVYKSNYILIELKESIKTVENKEDYLKILTGLCGSNNELVSDHCLYRIKLFSSVEVNNLHPRDKSEYILRNDHSLLTLNNNIYVEYSSYVKYKKSNDFIYFDMQGLSDTFLGSPIFIEKTNGVLLFLGIFTGKFNEFYKTTNKEITLKLKKNPFIAETFPNLQVLKDYNIISRDSNIDLKIKRILELYKDLGKRTSLNCAWMSLKTSGSNVITNCLKYLSNVNYLDLRCCDLGPLGAVNLAKNIFYLESLKNLNISFNKIGPKAIRCIALSFQFIPNLIILDISSNMLEDEGATHIIKYIMFLENLSYMDLSNNNFTEEGKNLIKLKKNDFCLLSVD